MNSYRKSDLLVAPCNYEAAKYAVEHWHYSKSMPTPPCFKFGVWENNNFIGCVIYSRGSASNIGKPYNLEQSQICELTRVALTKHQSNVSRIISITIKQLRKKSPKLSLVISFADSNQGHLGIIYQAGGWIYTGETDCSPKYLFRGKIMHSRQVSKNGINKQYGALRKTPKIKDCKKIIQLGKYKYLMPLTKQMRKQIKPLRKPYPKEISAGSVSNGMSGSTSLKVAV